MPYLHLLSDPGMNYTLNRPLLDGTSPARLKEVGSIVPKSRLRQLVLVVASACQDCEKEKRYLTPLRTTAARSFICRRGCW